VTEIELDIPLQDSHGHLFLNDVHLCLQTHLSEAVEAWSVGDFHTVVSEDGRSCKYVTYTIATESIIKSGVTLRGIFELVRIIYDQKIVTIRYLGITEKF
jgi:hypothetical protein